MALKNRDGSEFRLSKPNPLMAEQHAWDKGVKLIFHNKFGKTVTEADTTQPPKPIPLPETVTPKAVIQEPIVVKTLEEPEVGVPEDDRMQVWCLPASFKEYKDAMYGESYRKITYGKKFLFEAVLMEQGDLHIVLWCNTKAVTEASILFPRTHDKRWWRVEGTKADGEGYAIYAMISDYQPKFSD